MGASCTTVSKPKNSEFTWHLIHSGRDKFFLQPKPANQPKIQQIKSPFCNDIEFSPPETDGENQYNRYRRGDRNGA
jgi:hypothetical protein